MTLLGAALTTVSALLFLILFFLDSFGLLRNPYIGLLAYIALPVIFVFGLLLIPIGRWRSRRRRGRGEAGEGHASTSIVGGLAGPSRPSPWRLA